jgi:hypothetical protein
MLEGDGPFWPYAGNTDLSKRVSPGSKSSLIVPWLGLSRSSMKELCLDGRDPFEPFELFELFESLKLLPDRDPKRGIMQTISGFRAGVEAQTIARLASMLDQ